MSALGKKLNALGNQWSGLVAFRCPGCNRDHAIRVRSPNEPHPGDGPSWTFNGDGDRPTFSPSVHVKVNAPDVAGYNPAAKTSICHSFVTDGRIQFLGDCTHALAGQTVDLPDFPGGTA